MTRTREQDSSTLDDHPGRASSWCFVGCGLGLAGVVAQPLLSRELSDTVGLAVAWAAVLLVVTAAIVMRRRGVAMSGPVGAILALVVTGGLLAVGGLVAEGAVGGAVVAYVVVVLLIGLAVVLAKRGYDRRGSVTGR